MTGPLFPFGNNGPLWRDETHIARSFSRKRKWEVSIEFEAYVSSHPDPSLASLVTVLPFILQTSLKT